MNKRVVLLAVGLTAVAAVQGVRAFNPQPDPPGRYRFGMVGLAEGQIARLNVVSLADASGIDNPNIQPVVLELSFLDEAGRGLVTRDGTPIQSTVRLMRGRSAHLDLDWGAMIIDGGRIPFRALVKAAAPDGAGRKASDPEWIPTLEIFDAETGRTSVFLQPGTERFIKEVDPAPQS